MAKKQEPTCIEDSILIGILETLPDSNLSIKPEPQDARVTFSVTGNLKAALQRVYANEPVGALDVLNAVKAARSAVFTLKRQVATK